MNFKNKNILILLVFCFESSAILAMGSNSRRSSPTESRPQGNTASGPTVTQPSKPVPRRGYQTATRAHDCEINQTPIDKQIILDPREPSFFISVPPDGQHIGVIHGGENYIYDTDPNNQNANGTNNLIRVPGSEDPVYTPDGRFITTQM